MIAMSDREQPARCTYPRCRAPAVATLTVQRHDGPLEHQVCTIHRTLARPIAEHHDGYAYRLTSLEQAG
jgi:hypothetical protein